MPAFHVCVAAAGVSRKVDLDGPHQGSPSLVLPKLGREKRQHNKGELQVRSETRLVLLKCGERWEGYARK